MHPSIGLAIRTYIRIHLFFPLNLIRPSVCPSIHPSISLSLPLSLNITCHAYDTTCYRESYTIYPMVQNTTVCHVPYAYHDWSSTHHTSHTTYCLPCTEYSVPCVLYSVAYHMMSCRVISCHVLVFSAPLYCHMIQLMCFLSGHPYIQHHWLTFSLPCTISQGAVPEQRWLRLPGDVLERHVAGTGMREYMRACGSARGNAGSWVDQDIGPGWVRYGKSSIYDPHR